MTDSKNHISEAASLQGCVFHPNSTDELIEALDQAFDYRGDVLLELRSGARMEGYVFNRDSKSARPYLQIFPKGESTVKEVPYADIVAVAFTGEDTASGKSWEAWVAKKETQRRAESDAAAADARARGFL